MENLRGYNSQSYHEGVLEVELCTVATTLLGSFVCVGVLLLGVPTLTITCDRRISDAVRYQVVATSEIATLEHLLNMIKWQVLTSADLWLQAAEPNG